MPEDVSGTPVESSAEGAAHGKQDRPVRAALIGTGSIARAHIRAVADCASRIELVAAQDLDGDRCAAFCVEHNIQTSYTDVNTLLATERPELVLICTPPAVHAALSVACLEAGAWVLCEKPLCGSLAEMDLIEAAERRTGRYCSGVVQNRFGAGSLHLKGLIDRHALGRPLVGLCQTTWYRGEAYYAVPWHGSWTHAFGGPVMQLGIHTMDLFLWLWPDWEEISAYAGTLNHQMEVEDVSVATVRFKNGALASVINSAISPRQETVLRLDHERATVEAKYLYRHNTADWTYTAPDNAEWAAEIERLAVPAEEYQSSHSVQLAHLLDSMASGERPLVSGDEARRTIEFTSCLYKSAATGQPVKRGSLTLDDPFYRSVNGHALGG
jgi:predicted dehydrogenase